MLLIRWMGQSYRTFQCNGPKTKIGLPGLVPNTPVYHRTIVYLPFGPAQSEVLRGGPFLSYAGLYRYNLRRGLVANTMYLL